MRQLWTFAVYAVVATSTAVGQSVTNVEWPLDSGTKVRVKAATLGPSFRRGTLRSTTQDSIVIEPVRAETFSVGVDQIRSFQVLRESHTEKAKYTMIGLLIGAAGGALFGAATYTPSKCDSATSFCLDVFDRSSTTAIGAVTFGIVGGLVGLLAGASPKETWESIPVPSR